jgi:EAL domain-containing protein (putative c-di-GMP-specific phosphodiesterase class I)
MNQEPKGHVLLVDDEPAVLAICRRAIAAGGYEVTACADGAAAVAALDAATYVAVVSDLEMPNLGGLDLLRAVRRRDPDVPVILMTGRPTVETAALAVELGAHRYLLKPFPPARLLEYVDGAVRLHRLALAKREALILLGRETAPIADWVGLTLALDGALDTLWMAYQPLVRAADRRVVAFEALVRSSERRLPHPGALFDAAERLNRVQEVSATIRRLVAAAAPSAPDDALLFVNVHARDLLDDDLYSELAPLSAFARRTVLEVTERVTLDGVSGVPARVERLKDMGYRIAVDDLGAGYAGLTSFSLLSPDIVKLDLSLIRDIDKFPVKRKIVAAMTDVSHELGMQVVAEGIETRGEMNVVVDIGCDFLQGYFLGLPSPSFAGGAP